MKATVKKVLYDTETAKHIGGKFFGEFGQPGGYEEQLFVTPTKKNFIYGAGGPESPYSAPTIRPLTEKQAADWKAENM